MDATSEKKPLSTFTYPPEPKSFSEIYEDYRKKLNICFIIGDIRYICSEPIYCIEIDKQPFAAFSSSKILSQLENIMIRGWESISRISPPEYFDWNIEMSKLKTSFLFGRETSFLFGRKTHFFIQMEYPFDGKNTKDIPFYRNDTKLPKHIQDYAYDLGKFYAAIHSIRVCPYPKFISHPPGMSSFELKG
jgi:hypothetical protein